MSKILGDSPKRKIICIVLFSLITAFCIFVGREFECRDEVSIISVDFITKYFLWCGIIFLCAFLTVVLYRNFLGRFWNLSFIQKLPVPSEKLVVILPAVCYLLSLLSIFPGIFSYDCYQEWQMVEQMQVTSHHPVLHVLIAGGLAKVSNNLFGNGNAGIFLYVLVQISFLLFVISRIFTFMRSINVKAAFQWIALLFVSFSPMTNLYALVVSKDGLFAVFLLYFMLELIRLNREKNFLEDKKNIAAFVISALGAMIFRKNGVYVVVLTLVFEIFLIGERRKKLLIPFSLLLLLYLGYVFPFYQLHHVTPGSVREVIPLPIQQLARVHRFCPEDLTDNDLKVMYAVIDKENWEAYLPTSADAVKNGFHDDEFEVYGKEFIKIWIRQGLKNPMVYLNAFLVNTVDFWYPLSVNDPYGWMYGLNPEKSEFLDYRVAEPGVEIVINKPLHELYEYISSDLEVTSKVLPALILNPGVYLLLWIMVLLIDVARKNKIRVPAHIAMFFTFATVMLGPVAQVRYLAVLYFAVPLWLIGKDNE